MADRTDRPDVAAKRAAQRRAAVERREADRLLAWELTGLMIEANLMRARFRHTDGTLWRFEGLALVPDHATDHGT